MCWDRLFSLLDINLRGLVTTAVAVILQTYGQWSQLQGRISREIETKKMTFGIIV